MDKDAMISPSDKAAFATSSIFKNLPAEEMDALLLAFEIRTFQPNHVIMSSGDVGDGIYVILKGQAKVFLPMPKPTDDRSSKPTVKISLSTLSRGACFGEYSLVDQQPVSATVQALTPIRLAHLSTSAFGRMTRDFPLAENVIYKNLLRTLVSRCREVNMELDGNFLLY